MSNVASELVGIESFVENINKGLVECGISRDELAIMDHICYRVETTVRYAELLQKFGGTALLLDESEVSGRLIATFEFTEPIEMGGWRIPYLELPQPKEHSPYEEGLEHAEFVVVGGLERFAHRHRELPVDDKSMTKLINPEISLKHAGISVKFHELPLGAVVGIEQRLRREAAEKIQE